MNNNTFERTKYPADAHAILHLHTEYSLLDGMGKIPEVVKKAKECGAVACAITDHGVGYGLPEFYEQCKAEGIKPILGCEFYEAENSRFDKKRKEGEEKYYHLILLVKNEIGYKNLCILISRSNTEGFYYKPRIDFDLLEKHHEGLICLSACIAGRLPKAILSGDAAKAEEIALRYKSLFGEDYYFEIQNHGIREEATVAMELTRLSRKLGIKLVSTNDIHYVNSEDAKAHEWLLCIQTKKTITDPSHLRYQGDYSIKNREEMLQLFPSLPEAVDNTLEVAEKCTFEFTYGNYRMPKVTIPESYGEDYFNYLSDESWKGFEERYPSGHPERMQAEKNLNYELSVVKQMGFAEYFLDTRKTIMWARAHDILVGPGRGSGAGSTMNYCLKITDIDPIRYNLLFERFLNSERISMPDIDVDYDYAHKDEIIASEAVSNGKDRFAKIQTFGSMKAKGIVRDCARVAGFEPAVGDKLAKKIPNDLNATLTSAWNTNPELRDMINSDAKLSELWKIALRLEGTKKSASTHACGHIPTPVPCEELFPVSVDSDSSYLICQYNMADAEHLGNLKKDLLMLRNLTVINKAHQEIKKRYGKDIPLWNEEILNDKEALAMISSGDTNGVFQLESDGMKQFMKDLKPDCFEDIVAGVSLYRPGPMDFIPEYIKGKKNPSSIQYLTPELESILSPTYGVIVYQEQVMQIVQKLAGFSMGRADLVRKAMGKKKMAIMEEEGKNFVYGNTALNIPGCINNGIQEEAASSIYDSMIDFAKYAFNKSHAAAYAAITMQTAYLKCHYLIEFMTGLLTSVMESQVKLSKYINECRKKGIQILPPDVNSSEAEFTIKDGSILFGLLAIKGVGKEVISQIVDERNQNGKYDTISDLVSRNKAFDKRVADALVKAGALDFSRLSRKAMLLQINPLIEKCRKERKEQVAGQMTLLDYFSPEDENSQVLRDDIPDMPEYTKAEVLKMEKESTGLYISGHPLDEYASYLGTHATVSSSAFIEQESEDGTFTAAEVWNGQEAVVGGIITQVKQIFTKAGNRPMAFITIEDMEGPIDCVVFPKIYDNYKNLLCEDKKIYVSGHVSIEEEDGKASLLIDKMMDLETLPKKIWIQFSSMESYKKAEPDLKNFSMKYPGTDSLVLYIRDQRVKSEMRNCICSTEECTKALQNLFGNENVAVKI